MADKDWRIRSEEKFHHFSDVIYKNKYKVLLVILAAVIALASNLPKITIDTSTEGFLYQDDPQIRLFISR
jgi:predicted RND superfamily exporter protein